MKIRATNSNELELLKHLQIFPYFLRAILWRIFWRFQRNDKNIHSVVHFSFESVFFSHFCPRFVHYSYYSDLIRTEANKRGGNGLLVIGSFPSHRFDIYLHCTLRVPAVLAVDCRSSIHNSNAFILCFLLVPYVPVARTQIFRLFRASSFFLALFICSFFLLPVSLFLLLPHSQLQIKRSFRWENSCSFETNLSNVSALRLFLHCFFGWFSLFENCCYLAILLAGWLEGRHFSYAFHFTIYSCTRTHIFLSFAACFASHFLMVRIYFLSGSK